MRIARIVGLVAVVALLGVAVGCGKQEEDTEGALERAREETQETAGEVGRRLETEKKALVENARERLDELQAELNQLKQRAEEKSGEAKQAAQKAIEETEEKMASVRQRLDRIAAASGEAWAELKSGIQAGLKDIAQGIEETRSKLQDEAEEAEGQ